MAGFSVEDFPALVKLCVLDDAARSTALRSEEFRHLLEPYGKRDPERVLQRLSSIQARDTNLARMVK